MQLAMLMISAGLLFVPPISTGWASQYAPGVMDKVIVNRQAWDQIPDEIDQYDGFVAGRYPDEIGKAVWIRPVGTDEWELFLVVDCAGIADGGLAWMKRSGVLYEVDYQTAVRWDTVGRGIKIEVMSSNIGG